MYSHRHSRRGEVLPGVDHPVQRHLMQLVRLVEVLLDLLFNPLDGPRRLQLDHEALEVFLVLCRKVSSDDAPAKEGLGVLA